MTLGNLDSNGIGRYDETTPIGTEFSDYLNLILDNVSDVIGPLLRNRIHVGTATLAASSAAQTKTAAFTFPVGLFSEPPTVLFEQITSSGVVLVVIAESVTAAGGTMRISRADNGTYSGGYTQKYVAIQQVAP